MLSCVADLSSLSDYHVLDWLEAHEDRASQWTEDAQCHFSSAENTLVVLNPCAEPKHLF